MIFKVFKRKAHMMNINSAAGLARRIVLIKRVTVPGVLSIYSDFYIIFLVTFTYKGLFRKLSFFNRKIS